jgi:hypothetical protein
LTGKVFVSSGQRKEAGEQATATKIARLLESEFKLKPYLAFVVQSLGDIMAITKELASSDYYLFIDFKRNPNSSSDLAISLFTHQELALAHHLGFEDNIIALQQDGAPLEGFLLYVQSNPEKFSDESDLLAKVRNLVAAKGWSPTYSRNLVASDLQSSSIIEYRDHTGASAEVVWQAKIENRRPDRAAVNMVCVLESINSTPCDDHAYLKWANQSTYMITLLPGDFAFVDLFAVRANMQGLFLHSARDHIPRLPVIAGNGDYRLAFKVFADGFPLLPFEVDVELRWQAPTPPTWSTPAVAKLCPRG